MGCIHHDELDVLDLYICCRCGCVCSIRWSRSVFFFTYISHVICLYYWLFLGGTASSSNRKLVNIQPDWPAATLFWHCCLVVFTDEQQKEEREEDEEKEALKGKDEEERRIAEMGRPMLGDHVKLEIIIEESYEFKVRLTSIRPWGMFFHWQMSLSLWTTAAHVATHSGPCGAVEPDVSLLFRCRRSCHFHAMYPRHLLQVLRHRKQMALVQKTNKKNRSKVNAADLALRYDVRRYAVMIVHLIILIRNMC